MVVTYRTNRLQKIGNEEKTGIRELGPACAAKLRQRLAELKAFDTLNEVSHLPPSRCHELTNRGGVYSVDLQQPYRLLFVPANEPIPRKADGGMDLRRVTAVEVIDIEDTHDAKNQRRG